MGLHRTEAERSDLGRLRKRDILHQKHQRYNWVRGSIIGFDGVCLVDVWEH